VLLLGFASLTTNLRYTMRTLDEAVTVHLSHLFSLCCVENAHLPKRKLRVFALQKKKQEGR
jgi:hypothetical protein